MYACIFIKLLTCPDLHVSYHRYMLSVLIPDLALKEAKLRSHPPRVSRKQRREPNVWEAQIKLQNPIQT